ncbi:Disintegrin and metalloproteinase domain-containing protein 26A [Varanus komodoensis]|nr:Disintegrin and metalloproteinase domain-containing protein 26A [Varanus komodoensis]
MKRRRGEGPARAAGFSLLSPILDCLDCPLLCCPFMQKSRYFQGPGRTLGLPCVAGVFVPGVPITAWSCLLKTVRIRNVFPTQFLKSGTVCREPATECDLPEYCSGTSADCPPDVHKQDGMPCGSAGTCYRRKCLSLQKQCTALFGQGAQLAPLICFKEVNMQGDRSGNCGQGRALQFKKCPEEDVPCGRVQCTHVGRIPRAPAGHGIVQTTVEDTLCWGTAFHRGKDVDDLGAVRDGTSCGVNKVTAATSLPARRDPEPRSGREMGEPLARNSQVFSAEANHPAEG